MNDEIKKYQKLTTKRNTLIMRPRTKKKNVSNKNIPSELGIYLQNCNLVIII